MLLYYAKLFFLPSKFENFKNEKISDYKTLSFTKQKLAGLKTVGLVWLWVTFEGIFLCFGGQKFFKKYFSVCTKKLHKMEFQFFIFFINFFFFIIIIG